jgi:LuxR family maltose regulon positive regulatory protein
MSMWNHYNLRAWEAWVQLDRGNLKAAADWAKSVPLKTAGKLDPRFLGVYSVLAQVWASEGRFDEALDLLERTLTGEETGDRIDNVTGLLVLQAEVLQKQGEADKALRVLSRALSLAAPEGYVRTFLDRGEALGDLLQAAAASGVQPDYTGRLLKAWRQESQSSQSGQPEPVTAPSQSLLIDPLSERELEVLKYLGTSLTVPEIADQLYVAVSTVRSHTKNIYSKLDVHSRMEALRRAEELQLL